MPKTEKQKWQDFSANLKTVAYKHNGQAVDTLLDADGIWKPTRQDFRAVYEYAFGSGLVPWQKLDGTEMSPLVNGRRINLVPHWQSHYNRALEKGTLEALRDELYPNMVNGSIAVVEVI